MTRSNKTPKSAAQFRKAIPQSWSSVCVTVPNGETAEDYANTIELCLTVRGFHRAWAWSNAGDTQHIILATARLASLPVLLACVAGICRANETPTRVSHAA
jgi:hypothetical protein